MAENKNKNSVPSKWILTRMSISKAQNIQHHHVKQHNDTIIYTYEYTQWIIKVKKDVLMYADGLVSMLFWCYIFSNLRFHIHIRQSYKSWEKKTEIMFGLHITYTFLSFTHLLPLVFYIKFIFGPFEYNRATVLRNVTKKKFFVI